MKRITTGFVWEEMTQDLLRAGVKFAIRRLTQTDSDGDAGAYAVTGAAT